MLPEKNDPRWEKIITSDRDVALNNLATKMLLTRVRMLVKQDSSDAKIKEAINIAYDFFLKNESIVKADIEILFHMKTMYTLTEVINLINSKAHLLISGDESLINQLPKGNWVAGTIPYFMSERGGMISKSELQVIELPKTITDIKIKSYSRDQLQNIPKDYFANGFSYILIPAFSSSHITFAKNSFKYSGLFDRPLLGWISGHDLNDKNITAKVYNGETGIASQDEAIVLHCNLPNHQFAKINIINLFKPGNGDTIRFEKDGFEVIDCLINGKKQNFAEYIAKNHIDTKLPLVANYSGAMINVSFNKILTDQNKVTLYAPVFPDIDYKIAAPVTNYADEFNSELEKENISPLFSCNCILNYLHANLEGKKTGSITGPITFGEIAYILLNQTMVYLTIESKKS
jgi:hypothetical protein